MQHLPERLEFEGACNFRDLGGYPLENGRRVRRRRIFRSDHLARLTDGDQQRLRDIGLRTVVDLRRAEERKEAPDRIDDDSVRHVWLPVEAEGADVVSVRQAIERGEVSAAGARDFLIEANRLFATLFSPVFRDFLHLLLDESIYPLVFHCSAGKDRAGFAAALTLYALEASDDTVMHDYLATNRCNADYVNSIADTLSTMGLEVSIGAVRHLMRAAPEYLGEALQTIDREHGGVGAFLEERLDFDGAKRDRLAGLLAE